MKSVILLLAALALGGCGQSPAPMTLAEQQELECQMKWTRFRQVEAMIPALRHLKADQFEIAVLERFSPEHRNEARAHLILMYQISQTNRPAYLDPDRIFQYGSLALQRCSM